MTPRPGRAVAALVSGLGLAAGSLLVAPVAPASAAPENDSAAAVAGGDWLAGQLNADGLIDYAQFDAVNYGLTIDAGLTFGEFETARFDEPLERITSALGTSESIDGYTGTDGEVYSGPAGKLLSFITARNLEPTSVDGVDLRARVEDTVSSDEPITGRIEDTSAFGDFANVVSQGWAARGLLDSGSAEAGPAVDFLLHQQCAEGFFREGFSPKTEGDQSCDGDPNAAPSVDTTAFFVLNLAATEPAEGSDLAGAIDDAVTWLEEQQAANGSVGGDNANSTGLAGWALATVGADAAAQRAAVNVAGVQVAGFEQCEGELVPADTGAIALGRTPFDRDVVTGIDSAPKVEQWQVATAQALPVLRSLPTRSETATLEQASTARYVRAGRPTALRVTGLAPGQKDCVTGGGGAMSVVGPGRVSVDVPGGTATRTYRLRGVDASVSVKALGAKRLTVARKSTVARGTKQTVTVRGLAAKETVRVLFRGRRVASGTANGQGVYTTSFTVTGKKGKAPLKATGQFPQTRSGSKGFTVR